LLEFERQAWEQGHERLAGVDEAGRGPLAGPVAIAEAAPNNEAAQAYGVDLAKKRRLDPDELRLNIRAMLRRMGEAGPAARVDQMDMFGLSPELQAWKQQAEAEAKWVRERVTGLRERLAAIRGAAKNPAVARREGVDVRDERGIAERVRQLADELARWEAYDQHPDLLEEMRVGIKEGQGPEAEGRRSKGGASVVAEGPVPGAVPVAAGSVPGQAPAVEGRPPDAGVFTLEGVGRDVTRAEDEARIRKKLPAVASSVVLCIERRSIGFSLLFTVCIGFWGDWGNRELA
jgi:hypothetical protein